MTAAVAFRVDASQEIGYGHVTRCLALADALAELGFSSKFILRKHSNWAVEIIRRHGHTATLLTACLNSGKEDIESGRAHGHWLDMPCKEDARQTLQALAADPVGCVVIDHYGLDYRWEGFIRQATGAVIAVIDGLADRKHDCDLLLDPTYCEEGARRWDGLVPRETRLLVGPRYALLRPEFAEALSLRRARSGEIRRILIAFGGSDPSNATSVALEAVFLLGRGDLPIDVVVGGDNPKAAEIRERCARHGCARFHFDTTEMAKLMAEADVAIGGGGTMMWERLFLGLPAIVVSIAPNQVALSERVAETGAVLYLGPVEKTNPSQIMQALAVLVGAPERVRRMSERGRIILGNTATTGTVTVAREISNVVH